ncbi:MAG: DUF6088 family protein [Bacillota bacterium]
MPRPKHMQDIVKRICDAEDGAVFITSDFLDLADTQTVNKALSRLTEEGVIDRVTRGIYTKPRYSELLDKDIPPRSDAIAKAIARNHGWTIVPCGDAALNMLGLSTQVPAVWHYVSDGPYRTYEADGMTLAFQHTDNKGEVINVSHKTALVVQALRALGRPNITSADLHGISKLLREEEKAQMLSESKRITAWVYELIRSICRGTYETNR